MPVVAHVHMLPEEVLQFAAKILKQLKKLNHIYLLLSANVVQIILKEKHKLR